jgi:hypothetical protein
MSDLWVEEVAAKIVKAEAARRSHDELELSKNKKIAALAPYVYGDLVASMRKRIDGLNKALKERGIATSFVMLSKSHEKTIVKKEHLADVSLVLTLNLEAQIIEAVITKELREGTVPPQDTYRLALQVGIDGAVILKRGEQPMYITEAAELILESVIYPQTSF